MKVEVKIIETILQHMDLLIVKSNPQQNIFKRPIYNQPNILAKRLMDKLSIIETIVGAHQEIPDMRAPLDIYTVKERERAEA